MDGTGQWFQHPTDPGSLVQFPAAGRRAGRSLARACVAVRPRPMPGCARCFMLRIAGSGPHTLLLSTLCASCPQGHTGCCAGPPEYDWSDIGRVVVLGGRDQLLAWVESKTLTGSSRGLVLRRVRSRDATTTRRRPKCVHHGPTGCTISESLRPATCNYYLCEDAYQEPSARSDPSTWQACRDAHAWLASTYEGWDRTIARRMRDAWPEGIRWTPAFLDWLGDAFRELSEAELSRRAAGG